MALKGVPGYLLARQFSAGTIAVMLGLYGLCWGQANIAVDASAVLRQLQNVPFGINVNYLMDDDTYLSPAIDTRDALKEMGVKYLRYPGGEKSDNYLWSISPWESPNPHFARTGNSDWPSTDPNFAQNDRYTCKATVLDFDEFMSICQYVGAEPVIVVCFDAMYLAASDNGTAPTKQQLKDNAVEWVRYANVTKGYNVKYWEIGNESYHSGSYNGIAPSATVYAQNLSEFSQAMKTVDSSIKIGANGNSWWWSTMLSVAGDDIDFLSAHSYPTSYYAGYSQYRDNAPDFAGEVSSAISALGSSSTKFVALTEFNAIYWGDSGGWSNTSDLGHALAVFDMAAQNMLKSQVEFSLFWNTRWVHNATEDYSIYDAIDKNGELNATGQAISLLCNNVLGDMVSVSGTTTQVRAWASLSAAQDSLNIFLLNKGDGDITVNVSVSGFVPTTSAQRSEMSGTGPSDTEPVIQQKADVALAGSSAELSLPGVSITVLTCTTASTGDAAYFPGIVSSSHKPNLTDAAYFNLQGRAIPRLAEKIIPMGLVIVRERFSDRVSPKSWVRCPVARSTRQKP